MATPRTLAWLIDQYAQSRDAGKGTINQLRYSTGIFAKWLGYEPTLRDGSPVQQLFSSAKRGSTGDYSWIATITPTTPLAPLAGPSNVSIAVYYKRDFSLPPLGGPPKSEPAPLQVTFPGMSYNPPSAGQELLVFNPQSPIKPGSWVMLAGEITVPTPMGVYARWFRVLAADRIATGPNTQRITLARSDDWNVLPPAGNPNANPTLLWRFENVIAVYERTMTLDLD